MPSHEQPQPMDQIMARCWSDASYKAKLLADPVTVLHAAGVSVPEGVQLRGLENTAQVMHLVIPARPPACRTRCWMRSWAPAQRHRHPARAGMS